MLTLTLMGYWWCLSAFAQSVVTCGIGDAPVGLINDCLGTCTISGGDTLVCDVDKGGSTVGAVATVVEYAGAREYSAWGTDNNGADFCCYIDDSSSTNITWVTLHGDEYGNVLSFGTVSYGQLYSPESGDINGYGDTDIIRGSDSASFVEYLYGTNGDDVISGWNGPDFLYGDEGDDLIYGGGGDDTVEGGDGSDWLEGGAGADVLYGDVRPFGGLNYGDDVLHGDGGNDSLYGHLGSDVLCGGGTSGSGHDSLWPGIDFDFDQLWSPSSANTPTGSSYFGSLDSCGHTSHGSGWAGSYCSYSISAAPADCN